MNKYRILLSLIVAAGAAFFALRHHSLRQLKSEQDQLRQEVEQLTNAPVAPAPVALAAPADASLSAAERSELLRLRGQVGPLRQELAQATNELASLSRAKRTAAASAPDEPVVSRQEIMQKMTRGKQWMLALILYAQEHQQRFPGTLAEAASFNNQADGADIFEFVQTGMDIGTNQSPATTIVLREKQTWKSSNGRWNRAYAFADGHVENAVSDVNDFTDWETKHQSPQNQAR